MFSVIDIIFIIIIAITAFVSMAHGFITEIFNKISWVLGIILGFLFCNKLKVVLLQYVKYDLLAMILSFFVIFIVTFLIVQIIKVIIGSAFDNEIMKSLDKALGFFFGLIEGFAIVLLIIFLLSLQRFIPLDVIFEGSFFFHLLAPVLTIKENIPQELA